MLKTMESPQATATVSAVAVGTPVATWMEVITGATAVVSLCGAIVAVTVTVWVQLKRGKLLDAQIRHEELGIENDTREIEKTSSTVRGKGKKAPTPK